MFSSKANETKNISSSLETLIGSDTFLQGNLRSKGSLRIDGKIEGSISAEGVIIGEHGEIQGDISAKSVVIGGKVTGNVHATNSLELSSKSHVYGDLHAPQLTIAEGAVFEGSCLMASDKNKMVEVGASANA